MTTVQGLVSTFGDRIGRLTLPAPRKGVGYVIVHQSGTGTLPADLLARADVTYLPQAGRGLSRSRNAAIEAATADHLFVLDDDVAIDPDAMLRIAGRAASDGTDVAAYYHRLTDGTSTLPSSSADPQAAEPIRVGRLGVGSITSIDLSFRREAIVRSGVRFDTDFGLGATYPSCEEAVFLGDCLGAGLTIRRYPDAVCTHPPESSGLDFYSSPERVRPRRAMMRRIFGPAAPVFVLAFWAKKLPEAARAGHAGTFTRTMLGP